MTLSSFNSDNKEFFNSPSPYPIPHATQANTFEAVAPHLALPGYSSTAGSNSAPTITGNYPYDEQFFRNLNKYAWLGCVLIVVVALAMYFFFPSTPKGEIDKNFGIVQEINDRGSAQGNCEMPDATIATAFKIQPDLVQSYYIGAICRWVILSGNGIEVSYAWFESGALDREAEVNEKLGFDVSHIQFQGHPAILAKSKPETGCGLVTNYVGHGSQASTGVIQFWVQSQEGNFDKDPCIYAQKLMHIAFGEIE